MSDIITTIASNIGLDEGKAKEAIGMMLNFLQKEGPADAVQKLVAAFPGGVDLLAPAPQGGGMFGMGGIMGLGTQLMSAGLSMGQVQSLSKELFAKGREIAGDEVMGEIVAGIPGLSQFV